MSETFSGRSLHLIPMSGLIVRILIMPLPHLSCQESQLSVLQSPCEASVRPEKGNHGASRSVRKRKKTVFLNPLVHYMALLVQD